MDTVFSSDGAYNVSVKAGQYTLDECAIVRSDTPIHPYFIKPVDEDPDVQKLTVFLQTPGGEIVSKKVTYILDPDNGVSTPESGSQDSSGETDKTDPASVTEPAFTADPVPPEDPASAADPVSTDNPFSSDEPADAGLWDGTAEDTGENDDVYRVFKREIIPKPSLPYNEDIIYVKKLSGALPPLLLPPDIEAGQYTLVFQILGEKGILNRIDKPLYYIGAAEFTLDDIHAYLPGIFDRGHLVPPEMSVMLEAKLAAGTNLNPYVVWYNGKKRIHEGYIADGAARFIWQAPAQTGFHTLKVEAFPFKPLNTGVRIPMGKVKELSLPVSGKNESLSFGSIPAGSRTGFSEKELIPVRRYQLFANLEDSQSSAIARNVLTAVNHTPEWLPRGNIFGLAVGPDHSFSIPSPLFTPSSRDGAEGHLIFRFIPLADGVIFSGSFKLKPGLEPKEWFEILDMNLSYAGGMVILKYSAGSVSGEKNIFLFPGQTEGLVTVVISFEVQQYTLRLSLGLNTPAEFQSDEGIPLSGPLTGEGTFRLGTAPGETKAPSSQASAVETGAQVIEAETADRIFTEETVADDLNAQTPPVSVIETNPLSPVIILDEIVFLVAPDIPFNKTQAAVAVSAPSTGLLEDAPTEAITDGEDRIKSNSGETADEPETTMPIPSPEITDIEQAVTSY
jgi:hypothetical protein